jgi:ATP-dependent Clp protease ATP-binding subunit ClpC
MFENCNDEAREALARSQDAAIELKHNYIGTEHLLLGILGTTSVVAGLLHNKGVTVDKALELVIQIVGEGDEETVMRIPFTPRAKKVLELSMREALNLGSPYIGAEHLLLGLLREGEGAGWQILTTLCANVVELRAAILENYNEEAIVDTQPNLEAHGAPKGTKAKGALEKYTRNLTKAAKLGELSPMIGREKEIRRLMQTLVRRSKNNPVLIGEPGVGKTAIVEGLAQLIANNLVPVQLRGIDILELDLAGMLAGAKYRGDFEERVKTILSELKSRGNAILFIDEVHLLVGAGTAEGSSMDAAALFKPMLARGEIRTIGATTTAEYRKYFEKDAALVRRFAPIVVDEPVHAHAVDILKGLRESISRHHDIVIEDSAIEAAVTLSARYMTSRQLPDKAVDLLDEAGARLVISKYSQEKESLTKQLEENLKLLEKAQESTDPQTSSIEAHIAALKMRLSEFSLDDSRTINGENVAELIGEITGIPVTTIDTLEGARLLGLETTLRKRVVGQDATLNAVGRAVRRSRAGLRDPNRPAGSFIFAGPSGVGKTELAKALAEQLFGDEKALVVFDMSEYAEAHSISRLFGAPPGYVGFDAGGQLTEAIRKKPYCVLLLDEIEKANDEIFNSMLQVLEEGRLTDGQGRKVDFTNVIVIMTSNLGIREISKNNDMGFGRSTNNGDRARTTEKINEALKVRFKPEFLNRVDEIVVFHKLEKTHMLEIVDIMLAKVSLRLKAINLSLQITEDAKAWLAEHGYDQQLGARPLRRLITTQVEDPLSEMILNTTLLSGQIANIDVEAAGLGLSITSCDQEPLTVIPDVLSTVSK